MEETNIEEQNFFCHDNHYGSTPNTRMGQCLNQCELCKDSDMENKKIMEQTKTVIDNPPAFPHHGSAKYHQLSPTHSDDPRNQILQGGMLLRDYFAAKAMQAMLTGSTTFSSSFISENAYSMADAMLKQRQQP